MPGAADNNVLDKGFQLVAGGDLTSSNTDYRLIVGHDGNVLIYQSAHSIWATNTSYATGALLQLGYDGDLYVTPADMPFLLWESNTRDPNAMYARLENNGNFNLYDTFGNTVWSSGGSENATRDSFWCFFERILTYLK